ncbi:hypothetical protein BSKO_06702 [Bryopsis sp. KO-2023]|nr:hypothetical protein BSKO_06702 [Bryopsis sp. KO-2023]
MVASAQKKLGGFLFIAFFCALVISLASPPLAARTKGLLEENLNKDPYKIRIGWREGCISKEDCANGTRKLSDIFSNSASRHGIGVFSMLVVMVSATVVIFLTGALGLCLNSGSVNKVGVTATAIGAIFGILLLFIAPKFRNAVLGQIKKMSREHFDIACGEDAEVICKSSPSAFGCSGEYSIPEGRNITCRFQELDLVCEDDGDNFTGCASSKFIRDCSEEKAVCDLASDPAYQLILAQGVVWLLFAMFVMAVFVGRGLQRSANTTVFH